MRILNTFMDEKTLNHKDFICPLDSTINVLLYVLCACLCIYTSLYPSINLSYFGGALQSKLQASLYRLHPKYYAYHYLGGLRIFEPTIWIV